MITKARITLKLIYFLMVFAAFSPAACLRAAPLNPQFVVGSWIWDHEVRDRQECRFVRAFSIPRDTTVKSAFLRITADNSYRLFLDGELVGQGGDWRVLIEYDASLLLGPGEHTLAVSALNDFDAAGLLFGLRIVLRDNSVIEIPSDASWRVAPNIAVGWENKTADWERWRAATVERRFDGRELVSPLVYHAPISQPVKIELWQRGWFHVALSTVTIISITVGLFLASRLILKTQAERIIRRERARIAMDLHDGLGGGLTHLLLLGEASRPKDGEEAEAMRGWRQQVCDQSRQLLQEMNETVWLVNSQRDTIRDFASYVAKYAETFFRASPIRCRLDIQENMASLPCDLGIRRNLFLAVKEAMNNVLRHSQATVAQVEIQRQRQDLVVTISDNGRGFDAVRQRSGNGFRNMRLRASEAGARFIAESRPGEGCRLEFRVSPTPDRLRLSRMRLWMRKPVPAKNPDLCSGGTTSEPATPDTRI